MININEIIVYCEIVKNILYYSYINNSKNKRISFFDKSSKSLLS